MPLLLILLFIAVPLAELWVIIEIGGLIGTLPTIALLLADSVLGALLLRAQGRLAWRRFNQALAERRMPGREVFDGVTVIFGGALLLTPGFITDAVGLVLLIPPSRAALRRLLTRLVRRRLAVGSRVVFWGYDRYAGRRAGGPGAPPAGDRTAPPWQDRTTPSSGDRTAPSPGDRTAPPRGDRTTPPAGDPLGRRPSRDYDYEGTATEVDDDPQLGSPPPERQ